MASEIEQRPALAFAITEYQQNVLLAIAIQEKLQFKVAFIRENIALTPAFAAVCEHTVRIKDISYSWKKHIKHRQFPLISLISLVSLLSLFSLISLLQQSELIT